MQIGKGIITKANIRKYTYHLGDSTQVQMESVLAEKLKGAYGTHKSKTVKSVDSRKKPEATKSDTSIFASPVGPHTRTVVNLLDSDPEDGIHTNATGIVGPFSMKESDYVALQEDEWLTDEVSFLK